MSERSQRLLDYAIGFCIGLATSGLPDPWSPLAAFLLIVVVLTLILVWR